jgi:uncharacterized protein YlxW (UPF0749 family)
MREKANLSALMEGRGLPRLLTVVAITFLLAAAVTAQIKAQLIPSSNAVARDQELVRSVHALEADNAQLRTRIGSLTDTVDGLGAQLGRRSDAARAVEAQILQERELAGATAATGPGISVDLASGRDPHNPNDVRRGWQVGYVDIQDVVNLLWQAGAEGIAVNGQRVVPASSFYVAGQDVLLNGVHLSGPYRIEAIGDTARFNQELGDDSNLSDLKSRAELYELKFGWQGQRELRLPAFDGALVVRYALAGP